MPNRYWLVLVGAILALGPTPCAADPLNLDFEAIYAPLQVPFPTHWAGHDPAAISSDSTLAFSGRRSLRISLSRPDASATASQFLPRTVVSGKRFRLAGWVRTRAIEDGSAGLFVFARSAKGVVLIPGFDEERNVHGTTSWKRCSREVLVDSSVADFSFGVAQTGTGVSWFDSLSIDIDGVPYEPPPLLAPRTDPARLLSDDELVSDPDPKEPQESGPWSQWIRENGRPIRSLTEARFDDLRFLKQAIGSRRIVQIGENGHGVAQFDLAQTRLVRFLHEEMGFDVLAFETDFYQTWLANQSVLRAPPHEVLMSCQGSHRRDELLPLFEYVRETHRTKHALILAGVDIKGVPDRPANRDRFLAQAAAAVDAQLVPKVTLYESLLQDAWANGDIRPRVRRDPAAWRAVYDSLATALEYHMPELQRAFAKDPQAPMVALQLARNTGVFVRAVAADSTYETTRDRGMADNVEVLLGKLYPHSKLIVIAHNDHIRYANAAVARDPRRRMGTWLAERHPGDIYAIGLYMYRGQAAFLDHVVFDIRSSEPGTLESILFHGGRRYLFVDLMHAERTEGTSWMFSPIESFSWGWFRESIIPHDQYDGLFFVDTVSPPHYFTE